MALYALKDVVLLILSIGSYYLVLNRGLFLPACYHVHYFSNHDGYHSQFVTLCASNCCWSRVKLAADFL